jgi:hypothetical protein
VIAVLSILLLVTGGGVAAHAISDMESGHLWHTMPIDLAVLAGASTVFLAGLLLF